MISARFFVILQHFILILILGWQRRWFVLSENGVLSYYSSHEEVDQGCKGSMNVAACEIIVCQNDNTRLDIVVSHEKVTNTTEFRNNILS